MEGGKGLGSSEQGAERRTRDRRLASTLLSLITIGLFANDHTRVMFWPMAGWGMYREAGSYGPTTEVEELQLVIRFEGGGSTSVLVDAFLRRERNTFVDRLVRSCLTAPEPTRAHRRAYLFALAERSFGRSIAVIEVYRLRFLVDPRRHPVFDVSAPVERERLTAFAWERRS